jgi:hypothetical protein
MPCKSPEALARRRARRARRQAERRVDPAFRERENAPRRNGCPRPPAIPKFRRITDAPFVGCDGEGITNPKTGEHRYCLFRMGTRELYKGGRRLETPELLQFIVDHPEPRDYLVGFFFEYDINCSLLDIQRRRDVRHPDTPSRLERLLALDIAAWEGKPSPRKRDYWTWLNFDGFPEFGVNYIGRNHIKVCRSTWREAFDEDGRSLGMRRMADPDTIRTIEDVGANFQCSFVKALETWGIGDPATVARIAATKAERENFAKITDEIRAYNKLECELLAELMETFRKAALGAGIEPRTWNGAGKLGAAMLADNGVLKRVQYESRFPAGLRQMCRDSYYGGRFETTRAGLIAEPVNALDIRSAFPAAMLELPCLVHGRFRRASASTLNAAPRNALYVCPVKFTHPRSAFLCGLPIRSGKGPISWPRAGAGIYWSPEIRSAKRLGAKVELLGGWLYEKRCNCQPYEWIRGAYAERRKLDRLGQGRGIPIKLGVNAIYGKKAQRVGARTWANHLEASLITARVRAWLNDAIRSVGPRNVIMIAADCLFTVKRRPKVTIGKELGQWDAKRYPDLFIVQPGLYWPDSDKLAGARQLKTRGVSVKYFEPMVPAFEAAWFDYLQAVELGSLFKKTPATIRPPALAVATHAFISLRLAYRIKRLELGGRWIKLNRTISFGWASKRELEAMAGEAAILGPLPGSIDKWSMSYDEQGRRIAVVVRPDGELEGGELLASDAKEVLEAMPDMVDMSMPFVDE